MADVIFDAPIAQAPAKPSAVFRGLLHNPAILFGGTVIAHRAGGSSLPWRRHPAAPGPDGASGTGPGPDRPSVDPVPVGRSSDESAPV